MCSFDQVDVVLGDPDSHRAGADPVPAGRPTDVLVEIAARLHSRDDNAADRVCGALTWDFSSSNS